ncbi:MAG TPA: sigma-70 family RNA polymerase sigma factor [Flavobacteriales bacterium]|nr:sigma-70 family RNA polymerase sigma factor [Flavobacteriales bacterium]
MLLRRKAVTQGTDEELVLALAGGHHAALAALWDRYAHLLYGVGMKYLKDPDRAKDHVVELFAALPDLLRKHNVERFRPWVHTVMRNRCLLALRGDSRRTRIDDAHAIDLITEEAEDRLLQEATLQQLEAAIARLNDAQRQCITHFHLERRSYQETSALTGLTIEQVRSHLQNGRRNLRIQLLSHAEQNS